MGSTLIQLGPVGVSSYGLFLLLGFAVGLWRFVRSSSRLGLSEAQALDLGLSLLVAGLVAARAGYVLAHLSAYAAEPFLAVAVWRDGGLAFYGGAGGVVVACRVLRGRNWVRTLDALAAPAALGYAVGVLGALWGGLFVGRPTDLPWAVEVAGRLRHPVPVYLAVASLAAYRLLEHGDRAGAGPGQLALTYLLLHGVARFAAEFFTEPHVAPAILGMFSWGQVAAAVVAAASAAGLWRARQGQAAGGHAWTSPAEEDG